MVFYKISDIWLRFEISYQGQISCWLPFRYTCIRKGIMPCSYLWVMFHGISHGTCNNLIKVSDKEYNVLNIWNRISLNYLTQDLVSKEKINMWLGVISCIKSEINVKYLIKYNNILSTAYHIYWKFLLSNWTLMPYEILT